MTYTNVFATKEEIELMKQPVPYMVFGSTKDDSVPGGYRPNVGDSPLVRCHKIALRHGLPEIDGYYGCDLTTGEFVKA